MGGISFFTTTSQKYLDIHCDQGGRLTKDRDQ